MELYLHSSWRGAQLKEKSTGTTLPFHLHQQQQQQQQDNESVA